MGDRKRSAVALFLAVAAAPALCAGCDTKAQSCNEFYDIAAPIMSAVAVPKPAPTGSAAVTFTREAARQYERLAQEAGRIAEQETNKDVRSALQEEKRVAELIAKQLDALADGAASQDPPSIEATRRTLSRTSDSERNAASNLMDYCSR
jgi:uncharacterized lipoprotein YajG